MEAVVKHSEAYSVAALKMGEKSNNSARRAELKRISEICKRFPAQPAQDFYEAVQSIHFVTHCLSFNPFRMCHQQFQLGRTDRYLWPFYEKDIHNSTITKEFAQLLLDCLGIQINMRVPNGLSSGYMVGGRNEKGEIISNELTDMCMQVISDIRLVYPSVGLCCNEGMSEKHIDKACEQLLSGYSHPAIFNDDVIAKGLIYYGLPKKQAHNYIHSTCVEITPIAASNAWIASPYTNMTQILLEIMDREFDSFQELIKGYFEVLDNRIKVNFENNEALRLYILNRIPKYGNDIDEVDSLYSVFTEHIAEECQKYNGLFENSKAIPSIFCWVMHEYFGRETIATPDGRKSGFPLGEGSDPCQGREMNRPTASILSSTK